MWPFSSDDDDVMSVSSESDYLNNLNIPPDIDGGNWISKAGQLFYLLGPVALAYVHWRDSEEQKIKCAEIKMLEEKVGLHVQTKDIELKKQKVIEEEEARAIETLKRLNNIEESIKVFLDIRCSQLNPWKTRGGREKVEFDLVRSAREENRLSQLGIEEGLQQIFTYDHLHCGDGINSNGQIYRVWMKHWRSMVHAQKNKRIVSRMGRMLDELADAK